MNKIIIQKLSFLFSTALLAASCSYTVQTNKQDKERLKQHEINTRVSQIIGKRDFLTDFKNFTQEAQQKVEKNNQSIQEVRRLIIEDRKSSKSEFAGKIKQFDYRNKVVQRKVAAFDQSHYSDSEWKDSRADPKLGFAEEFLKGFNR